MLSGLAWCHLMRLNYTTTFGPAEFFAVQCVGLFHVTLPLTRQSPWLPSIPGCGAGEQI